KREWLQHEERMLANGFFEPAARDLPAKLKALSESGVHLVGWTARTRYVEDRTRKILKSLGLELDSIIFGGPQKWRSLNAWANKNRISGSTLVVDNRVRNLERLQSEKGPASHFEPIHYSRPPPWVDAATIQGIWQPESSKKLLQKLENALTHNQYP